MIFYRKEIFIKFLDSCVQSLFFSCTSCLTNIYAEILHHKRYRITHILNVLRSTIPFNENQHKLSGIVRLIFLNYLKINPTAHLQRNRNVRLNLRTLTVQVD